MKLVGWLWVGMVLLARLSGAELPVEVVIFDCGGVMVNSQPELNVAYISRTLGIEWSVVKHTLSEAKRVLTKGEIDEHVFWEEYARAHGGHLPDNWVERYQEHYFKRLKERPGMRQLVLALQAQGYRTAMISNVIPSRVPLFAEVGLYTLFDPAVLSCEVEMAKPQPEIYHYLLDRVNVPVDQCLFIDDKCPNVRAARQLGMHAVHFSSLKQLKGQLSEHGINPYVALASPEEADRVECCEQSNADVSKDCLPHGHFAEDAE